MINRNLVAATAALLLVSACKKTETNTCTTVIGSPTQAEIASVNNYITTNSLTAQLDSSGFYYNISFSGTGTSPQPADSVVVKYAGKLTSGTQFDATPSGVTRTFLLSDLIPGWQHGLPLLKKGGIIDLYLPPAMGYGCYNVGSVPSNSITIFRVELVDFF